jgi:hypothetical protein
MQTVFFYFILEWNKAAKTEQHVKLFDSLFQYHITKYACGRPTTS